MNRILRYLLRTALWRAVAAAFAGSLGLGLADCARGADDRVHDLALYYLLGGGRATDIAASERRGAAPLKGPAAPLGSACAGFSHTVDVLDILSARLEDSLTALSAVPQAVTSALPGSVLCRAKPGACQLLQHYLVRAEERWNWSVEECRRDFDAAARPATPRQDLLEAARTEVWETEAGRGESAASAKRSADASDGCVTWIGNRRAGCRGAPPIWLLRDAAQAGWCLLLDAPSDCREAAPRSDEARPDSPLRRAWPTSEAAGHWVVRVLGDFRIQAGEAVETVVGEGLLPQVDRLTDSLAETLRERVYSADPEGGAGELAFAGADVALAAPVIEALRDLPDRDFLIRRLANEAALAETLEQAFLARRLLLSGLMEPHIQRGGGVADTVAAQVSVLEREIERAGWELQARRQAVSGTVLEVLAAHRALSTPQAPRRTAPEWLLR